MNKKYRKVIIAGNWKMNQLPSGVKPFVEELKTKLLRKGYKFYSETDTEVAVKLIDYYYKKYEGTPVDAINHSMVRIRGSYALAIMFKDYPEEIYVAR